MVKRRFGAPVQHVERTITIAADAAMVWFVASAVDREL
jgi:hypothetical protein